MFIRQYFQNENGVRRAYWALVESYRTDAGPRQRIVSWLGRLDEAGRLGVEQAARDANEWPAAKSAKKHTRQLALFDQPRDEDQTPVEPRWVEVNGAAVRVENSVRFGGPWLALELVRRLKLDEFLKTVMAGGREHVKWWRSALILVVARLCRRWPFDPVRRCCRRDLSAATGYPTPEAASISLVVRIENRRFGRK